MHIALMAALLCATAEPSAAAPAAGAPASAAASPQRKKNGKPPMAGVLNLNRATEAELQLLPGIGKRRAQLIVERRAKKPFANVDEVGRIKGMRAIVHRLRSHLVVEGDTTLRPLRP
jgi:competence protein ComEA